MVGILLQDPIFSRVILDVTVGMLLGVFAGITTNIVTSDDILASTSAPTVNIGRTAVLGAIVLTTLDFSMYDIHDWR